MGNFCKSHPCDTVMYSTGVMNLWVAIDNMLATAPFPMVQIISTSRPAPDACRSILRTDGSCRPSSLLACENIAGQRFWHHDIACWTNRPVGGCAVPQRCLKSASS